MRESRDVFHLAIPVYDLDESQEFYVGALGCKLARRYADRITLDFFGDQLVCHLVDPPQEKPDELALYPRHFGPPALDARDADVFVARTLAKALPALKQQIELALALEQEGARDAASASPRSAPEITRSFAAALPKIRAALDKDVRAAFANDPSAKSIDEVIFCFPGVAAIMRHRLAHELYRLGAPLLARIVAEIAHALAGVDIHPGAEIEEGFFIDQSWLN